MGDPPEQQSVQPSAEDMIASVNALDAALFPCLHEIEPRPDTVLDLQAPLTTAFEELPATEHEPPDEYPPPSDHQTDVEKHVRDFMEAAKKLQRYFLSLQRENKPTKAETLGKEIAVMEEELKMKEELIQKQEKRIQDWKEELRSRLDKHNSELERV
ncbi:mediator of RNA polymerase II transcription subunit 28-like [Melia azedarach]|uniref:Mediator of RNA polymerase II transcription subunit 28-like n=1 Tax=Melia azedarach TaxID=155640 RepID=A0ACC1XJN5_MELAZ|nr:mediator of RNA polymerase II transcription subunit 28-like [Melia azedarach]